MACPQCGSTNVTGTPIPGGTHYVCLDCGYEWNVGGPPPSYIGLWLLLGATIFLLVFGGKS